MATPSCVKTYNLLRRPPHDELDITICDFKFVSSWLSSWNMKSSGNLALFLFTDWISTPVVTPYI
ncbi:MAG: hypothetical protein A2X48_15410 [Lentisphaerae bacterium GWF2_49_21]|nr:MAG: hypothetical protein A2X48_15410 [Lentisphaerae bacterium GWF2_49_21]